MSNKNMSVQSSGTTNEQKYIVNYDKKTLQLHYQGNVYDFDLNDGDVGAFWHTLETPAGVKKDVNYFCEYNSTTDATKRIEQLAVYELVEQTNGTLINTFDDFEGIENIRTIGDVANYLGKNEDCYIDNPNEPNLSNFTDLESAFDFLNNNY